jgi:putative flippase GtrA
VRARSAVLLGEVARFGFVGALSYGLGVALAAMFHEVLGVPEKGAVGASLAIVLVTNFFLARTFIFRSAGDVRHEVARFVVTSATMRGLEYALFIVLLNYAGIGYLIAMTVAMALSTIAKFFIYRTLVFRMPLRGAGRTP